MPFHLCPANKLNGLSIYYLIPLIFIFSIFLLCLFFPFNLPTCCRSILVAVISCILLLLPACSLGAVMCGSMGGGCGGLCPDHLRTPSQRNNASNTAAKILLRFGTQVYVWFMYIVVGSHFYTSISLSLYAGVF